MAIIFLRLPGGSFDIWSLTPVDGHPDQPLPEEILNLFRFCTLKLWKPGVLAYATLVLAFGAFSPSSFGVWRSKNPTFCVTDILAFSIIAFKARKELPPTSWGIRSLWTVILRDATLYFVIISFIQFCALLLPFVTTVSVIWYVRRYCAHHGCTFSNQSKSCPQRKSLFPDVDAIPGCLTSTRVNAIVVPILASRLMLSLKMAAAKPAQVSSFRLTTTVLRTGNNIEFAPVL